MDCGRSRHIFAALERSIATAVVGDEPAGFADQQHARGGVPQGQAVLPETIHLAGRDPGEVERGGAEAADAGNVRRDRSVDFCPLDWIAAAQERNSGADQAVGEFPPRGYAKPRVLEPRPPTLFGPEALVRERLIDEALGDFAAAARLPLFDRD